MSGSEVNGHGSAILYTESSSGEGDSMPKLRANDLCVAPIYIMTGRKSHEQTAILYVWQAELSGETWSVSSVAKRAGTTPPTLTKVCAGLVEAGVMYRREGKRAPYGIHVDFVPERDDPVVQPKNKAAFPFWVFQIIKAWKTLGVVSPREVYNYLHSAVDLYGQSDVVDAATHYVAASDIRFNPSLSKFRGVVGGLLQERDSSRQHKSRSMADLV